MKRKITDFLIKLNRRSKRIAVYALIGRAGSGKSFRAKLISNKYKIEYIIDDGLMIKDNYIIAGKSAKREENRPKAVKRSIFFYEDHKNQIKEEIKKHKPKSILILGISEKMIKRIIDRLELPQPIKIIYINDIATPDEISRAKNIRKQQGKHVIPAPVLEVEKDSAHHIIDSLKLFFLDRGRFKKKRKFFEKTVVQTPYIRGKLYISEQGLTQMILHCIDEYNDDIVADKVIIRKSPDGYYINLRLMLPIKKNIPGHLENMQTYIIKNVETYTGIYIKELNIIVDKIRNKTQGK
ncbi:MAG: hypothetical protein R6V04_14580 [bacterium]